MSRDPTEWLIETGIACIGTPDDAIAYIERLLEGLAAASARSCELAHNWADWAATKRHYELMARYVHPHFQTSREWRRESYVMRATTTTSSLARPARRCRRRSTGWPPSARRRPDRA